MKTDEATNNSVREPIAIVGIGCRLPGSICDPPGFWNLLERGEDVLTDCPPERLSYFGRDEEVDVKEPLFRGAFLSDVARFDADFFNIPPREASAMDPQQRLLLEVAWESMEDAGWPIKQVRNTQTGVFVGAMGCDYLSLHQQQGSLTQYTALGLDTSLIANRISYFLGLQGPSLTINTASSSSLVAVHMACQSLRAGEIEMALVGGVNLILNLRTSRAIGQMKVLSPDGRGHAFTIGPKGYVRGEGIICIALKKFSRAVADNDRIYCLITGSAVNNNGAHSGIAAPRQEAQVQLLKAAYEQAGVSPQNVQYVEAHGSGTAAGDTAEIEALLNYFGSEREAGSPLLIGTVKNNIGHLEAAAGIAGLVKVALSISNSTLSRSIINGRLLPAIDDKSLSLRLLDRNENWPVPEKAALAGVSSFGYGGTNCHVVVAGAISTDHELPTTNSGLTGKKNSLSVESQSLEWETETRLVPVSAFSPQALAGFARVAAAALQNESSRGVLKDWAYTAARRRTHHPFRKAILAESCADLRNQLIKLSTNPVSDAVCSRATPSEVVLWLGSNETAWNSSVDENLLKNSIYRRSFRECEAVVRQIWGWQLIDNFNRPDESSIESKQSVPALLEWARRRSLLELAKAAGLPTGRIIAAGLGRIIAAHLRGLYSTVETARKVFDWNLTDRKTSPATAQPETYFWFDEKNTDDNPNQCRILVGVCDLAGIKAELKSQTPPEIPFDADVIVLQSEAANGFSDVLKALGEIYEKGGNINWSCQYPDKSNKLISLPFYQWQGRAYWLMPDSGRFDSAGKNAVKTQSPTNKLENGNGSELRFAGGSGKDSQSKPNFSDISLTDLFDPQRRDESSFISIIKTYLIKLLADALGHEPAELDSTIPLLYLGVESLTAMELEHSVANDCGIQLSLKQQLNEISLDQLAELVAAQIIFLRRQSPGKLGGFGSKRTETELEFKRL